MVRSNWCAVWLTHASVRGKAHETAVRPVLMCGCRSRNTQIQKNGNEVVKMESHWREGIKMRKSWSWCRPKLVKQEWFGTDMLFETKMASTPNQIMTWCVCGHRGKDGKIFCSRIWKPFDSLHQIWTAVHQLTLLETDYQPEGETEMLERFVFSRHIRCLRIFSERMAAHIVLKTPQAAFNAHFCVCVPSGEGGRPNSCTGQRWALKRPVFRLKEGVEGLQLEAILLLVAGGWTSVSCVHLLFLPPTFTEHNSIFVDTPLCSRFFLFSFSNTTLCLWLFKMRLSFTKQISPKLESLKQLSLVSFKVQEFICIYLQKDLETFVKQSSTKCTLIWPTTFVETTQNGLLKDCFLFLLITQNLSGRRKQRRRWEFQSSILCTFFYKTTSNKVKKHI